MSQELMAQSNTVEAQLSVHRSLRNTAKALKETRIDGPFPPEILLRLQKSFDFVFKHCEAHRNRERQRHLQQKLGFADLIVCCMSFGLSSMLITEFDFMVIYADAFVRDQDLKRRLYHPGVQEQLKKSESDIEHQASHEQFMKDYYKYDFYLYMGGVPSYVPQPEFRSFNIVSQIEDKGYIEFYTLQAQFLTEDDVMAILRSQDFTPGQITLLLPGKSEEQPFIIIGLTTKCTKVLNDRLAKHYQGTSETQPHEPRRLSIGGTWDLTKGDVERKPRSDEGTGPIVFVPSTKIHQPSYVAVPISWQIGILLVHKHSRKVRHRLNEHGGLIEQME